MKTFKSAQKAAIALSALILAGSTLPSFAQEESRPNHYRHWKHEYKHEADKGPGSIYEPPFGGNG